MQTIIVGTTNKAKLKQIGDALAPIGVEVIGIESVKNLPDVLEDGISAQENARKKAVAYAQVLNQRVLSMDNALYLSGLAPEVQPGTHVRRIDGNERATDDELLSYYQKLIHVLGDKVEGYWEFAICIADPNGSVYETTVKTPRVFTSERSSKIVNGYPLESIQINPESGVYLADMTPQEHATYWQQAIGTELCVLVKSVL